MQDSVWSGPVLAGALIASASLLVVLSTQVEVTPPPPPEKLVEHRTCSQLDIETLRERIARIQRQQFEDSLACQPRSRSDAELDRWRSEEIMKARNYLADCRIAMNVDLCEGFDVGDAQREIAWLHEVRSQFRHRWYFERELPALEMLTGMCGMARARAWPSPPDPWVEEQRAQERRMLGMDGSDGIQLSATH